MTEILHRRMDAAIVGGQRILEAVRLSDAGVPGAICIVMAQGADARALGLEASGLQGGVVRTVGGCPFVTGIAPGGGPLRCAAGDLALADPEHDLFAGTDALMATRNGEDAEAVADWLRYHAERFGAETALILDRRRPNEPPLQGALTGLAVPGLARVVVLEAGGPLGADAPSERHPIQAPDAPGKDRMERPADDPWTAPLAQIGVYEAMRWRFLARATAVCSLDCHDLLAPGAAPFAAARAAASGVVPLLGRRIYPWRVRKGEPARFGDHICDRFDAEGGNRRWACVPARVEATDAWRLVRVGGAAADPAAAQFFLRAMAMRAETLDLPLAPKSSLTPDDGLLAMAAEVWDHKPVLPPAAPETRPDALPAAAPGRTAIVTCMKNEGPFVLEWLAHHRAIGVDDFLVYTNDCTDGTDALLDLLQSHGIVQHRANPFREPEYEGFKPQHAALAAAEREGIMDRAGWAVCMDVDEFIDVRVGAGHLRDLYAAVGDANMISMTWRLFGNADLATYDEVPTPARFTRCAPELIRKPHQAWGFKTLFRNMDIYRKMGVHRPKGLRPELWEEIRWVNGSGQPMPKEMLRNGWRSTVDTYGYDLVALNHYAVRDAESFLVKRDRGRVNHVERDQGLGYWFRMNNNAEESRSMLRHVPALEREMARLLAMPGVEAQHRACVEAHRAKIAALRATEAFGAFYGDITGARMRRLSRIHAAFGANVFLAGPEAVPDDVVFGEHGEGFFFTLEGVEETAH
ncbi:glycosyltransferase family 2 protein [Jannaschia sp. W003]|uniref:glycosyltransferase family 2 protein n=1 Tax=Jannaschia sp. W003 TaxID=2867012 RepID=UPI0021A83DB1|nr:glycosyltransferase family 2 protein [Jannaschia sp. W003]UWQ20369.1 glycosyltransferase family 2 protein [Jannaschia sp. W003]